MVTLDNYLFFAWAGREMMYKCTYFDENFSHRWNIDWIDKKKTDIQVAETWKKAKFTIPTRS